MDEWWVQRYYLFESTKFRGGINLPKIFKVDNKSPFTDCVLC